MYEIGVAQSWVSTDYEQPAGVGSRSPRLRKLLDPIRALVLKQDYLSLGLLHGLVTVVSHAA